MAKTKQTKLYGFQCRRGKEMKLIPIANLDASKSNYPAMIAELREQGWTRIGPRFYRLHRKASR